MTFPEEWMRKKWSSEKGNGNCSDYQEEKLECDQIQDEALCGISDRAGLEKGGYFSLG